VLMPFAPTFTPVYKRSIVPTLTGLKWICKRADEILKPSEIIMLIWQEILRADLIIADLTGRNPNVFYELGYAHALHKNTILITQSINDVPFDLRHRQMIQYSASPKGYADLTKTLTKYL
jgi:nucleoside 2-deoxyribosyltransferase